MSKNWQTFSYTATINDNCLLLNIPPDTQGKQNPKAIENILTLARQLVLKTQNLSQKN